MFEAWDKTARALRRRMRVFPQPSKPENPPQHAESDEQRRRSDDARRVAVVSIFGKDLTSEDEIAGARPERSERQDRRRKAA